MSGEASRVRLLPWTGPNGQPGILLTDGHGGAASRLADQIENVQLCLANRLLARTRNVLSARPHGGECGELTAQLADALEDALLIADSRGARLNGERMAVEGGTGSALFTRQEPHHALAHHHFETRRLGALSLPGHDLTSASTARRYVHETAHSWGLSPATADDLETIVGELVANALEHSDSHTITVTCSLTPDTAAVSVTDQGRGRTRVPFAESSRPKELEQESGRGLLITDALATQWGTRQTSSGLTVWAEVALDSPEPAE